jgi:hypothetical protein
MSKVAFVNFRQEIDFHCISGLTHFLRPLLGHEVAEWFHSILISNDSEVSIFCI